MIALKVLGFLAMGQAIPLVFFWSNGAFVGQRPVKFWVTWTIRSALAVSLFLICAWATIMAYRAFRNEWYVLPLCAWVAGTGICGIVGINVYDGEKNTDGENYGDMAEGSTAKTRPRSSAG